MGAAAVHNHVGRGLPVLASLVGDVERFDAVHWGRRPLHRSTACGFGDLLSLDDVDRLVATGVRRPAFRLVRDGASLGPKAGIRPTRLGGRELDDVADPDEVARELASGASLVLQGLHRTWPPIDRWCRRLEAELSHPVQANAYLTPDGSTGLSEHADDHDVLVLQVAGAKEWTIEGLGRRTLRPGDVAYIPADIRHAASTSRVHSLHVTIGILRTTARAAIERALRAVPHPDLDRPLPLGHDHPERRAALEAALAVARQAAMAALADLDEAAVARTEVDRRAARRRRAGTGRVRSVVELDELGEDTVVVLRWDRSIRRIDEHGDDGRAVLALADRRISAPAEMGPALDVLMAGAPVRLDDLPGLDTGDRRVLVRRLVLEGMLDVVQSGGGA